MVDDGHAVHYTAVERGTPVHSSDGSRVGTVDEVIDNYDEHILDGIVIEDADGKLRFVDGPEVARTAERRVTLKISAAQVGELPPPQKAPPRFSPSRSRSRIGRLFGGGWKRR
jgi:sporulation protein YlmC with PRC-barrel domain